jgi:hypothetical protein
MRQIETALPYKMSIQIEFEWEKDNLTETMLHLLQAQPKQWLEHLEEDQEPTFERFEDIFFNKLQRYFDRDSRRQPGSAVEPLLRPLWICYVVSDQIAMHGHDQMFGGLRVIRHLGMLESGFHSTRVMRYDSQESKLLGVKLVLLTRL